MKYCFGAMSGSFAIWWFLIDAGQSPPLGPLHPVLRGQGVQLQARRLLQRRRQPKSRHACCATTAYNLTTQVCCHGHVHFRGLNDASEGPKENNPGELACCGTKLFRWVKQTNQADKEGSFSSSISFDSQKKVQMLSVKNPEKKKNYPADPRLRSGLKPSGNKLLINVYSCDARTIDRVWTNYSLEWEAPASVGGFCAEPSCTSGFLSTRDVGRCVAGPGGTCVAVGGSTSELASAPGARRPSLAHADAHAHDRFQHLAHVPLDRLVLQDPRPRKDLAQRQPHPCPSETAAQPPHPT